MERTVKLWERFLRKIEIESELAELEKSMEVLKGRQVEAIYEKREAESALLSYENDGLRRLIDKFSGKGEEKLNTLRAAARMAGTQLDDLKRDMERQIFRSCEMQKELDGLGDCENAALKEESLKKPVAGAMAAFLIDKMLPELEENNAALEQAHKWIRPDVRFGLEETNRMRYGALSRAGQVARKTAQQIQELNQRLEILDMTPVQLGSYYEAPEAFIAAVAAQYGQLDRINSAQKQIRELRDLLMEIRAMLE